jgi:hypothetical protein
MAPPITWKRSPGSAGRRSSLATTAPQPARSNSGIEIRLVARRQRMRPAGWSGAMQLGGPRQRRRRSEFNFGISLRWSM